MIPTPQRLELRNKSFLDYAEYSGTKTFEINLRKKKRQEIIHKKRMKEIDRRRVSVSPEDFEKFGEILGENNKSEIFKVLEILKDVVSSKEVNFDSLILNDVIGKVMMILSEDWEDHILQTASLVITNLCYFNGNVINYMVERGVTEVLIKVLGKTQVITENVILAFGNLALEGEEICEMIINTGFLKILPRYLEQMVEFNYDISSFTLFTAFNLSKKVRVLTPAVAEFIIYILQVLKNCIPVTQLGIYWVKIVACLAKRFKYGGDIAVEKDFVSIIVKLINKENNDELVISALLAAGNIEYSSDKNSLVLLNLGLLNSIENIFHKAKPEVLFVIYWILSNVAGGTPQQAHLLISHSLCFLSFDGLFDSNDKIAREASYVLFNCTVKGLEEDMKLLISKGAFDAIDQVIRRRDVQMQVNLLKAVLNLMYALSPSSEDLERLAKLDLWDAVEDYCSCGDENIRTIANLVNNKTKEIFVLGMF